VPAEPGRDELSSLGSPTAHLRVDWVRWPVLQQDCEISGGAFAAFFLIEAADRIALLFSSKPNEASPWIYVVRLLALLLIVAAILNKNYGGAR
jgi:hypothetical protein